MSVAALTATVVRHYRPGDRQQVRAIVCSTAFRNRGHRVMVDDPELFADYWSSYYTDVEPESCLVAERDGVVVGYLLGCVDTVSYQRTMTRSIVPAVLRRLVVRGAREVLHGRTREVRLLRWLLTRGWREAPPIDLARFPAHYHLNLLRTVTGERLYTQMALQFMERARSLGAVGAHGQVLDRLERGVWQQLVTDFRQHHPEVEVVENWRESTMTQALMGQTTPAHGTSPSRVRLANRAFGASIEGFVTFLEWMREWRRL